MTEQDMTPSSPELAAQRRDLINQCVALKAMPHIYDRLKKMWGYPEFFEYIDSVLLMEPGREGRAGLPYGVYKELDALERIFLKYPEDIMHPSLNQRERDQIHNMVRDRVIKINYTTGDRR